MRDPVSAASDARFGDQHAHPAGAAASVDYNARAAMFLQQKFCDPHEGDYPDLQEHLEDNGIPTLFLEFDITSPLGPFRVRVKAFLETLSAEELF